MSEMLQQQQSGAAPAQRVPDINTLSQCAKLAIVEDKPIMLDYWAASISKQAIIGVRDDETKEKMLIKSDNEFTSPTNRIYKVGKDYIIITENSIYVVDVEIPMRRVKFPVPPEDKEL